MTVDWGHATLLLVNATHGLSLGLSVVVLTDVIPWKSVKRHVWATSAMLILAWMPFALSGIPVVRRLGNAVVALYLCWLFLTYAAQEKKRERVRKERYEAGCRHARGM